MVADDDSDDVLSHLPRTRPARRSARRATAATDDAAAAKPKPKAAKPKPKAAKPKTPEPPAAEPVPPSTRRPIEPPSATEILQTAARAAGDLAHVGLAIGREALRAARSKLPKP